MIFLLTIKDLVLNAFTWGWWGKIQGERRARVTVKNVYRIKSAK